MAVEAIDLAYLAGLIDGDGCILLLNRTKAKTSGDRRRGRGYQIAVKVGGEPDHLRSLKIFHGIGMIYIRRRADQRHLAEWTIAGKQARNLLVSLLPYLRLKLSQAEVAIACPMPRSRWGVTPELEAQQLNHYRQMRRLNMTGRGREITDGSGT